MHAHLITNYRSRCLQGRHKIKVFDLLIQVGLLILLTGIWVKNIHCKIKKDTITVVTIILGTSYFNILKFRHHFWYFIHQFGHMLINVSFTNLLSTCNHLDQTMMRVQCFRLLLLKLA